MDLGLAGKRALVTGASGGIGQAVARELAAEGVEVVAHYHRNREAAEALGGLALGADLRDEAQVDELFAAAGPLDLCVANAGVWPSEDVPVAELPLERWRATIDGNLTRHVPDRARVRTASGGERALVLDRLDRRPLRRGRPRRLRGGQGGDRPRPAAVAQERDRAARASTSSRPGWTVSPMTEASLTDELVDRVTATMPLRKVARTEDIARTVVFLLSDRAAGHITGEVVTVAGGMEGRLLHDC